MQLTKHTDYAFRVLIYLANMSEDRTTIAVITERFEVSKSHLMKVVNELVNCGWVESTRGKNGGISLAIKAEQITLKDVVVAMEKNLDPINCHSPECYINEVCQLKPILVSAQNQYLDFLGGYSLADVGSSEIKGLIIRSAGE